MDQPSVKKKGSVLTRAGRQRAGVPPPTPFFRGAPNIKSTSQAKSDQNNDTSTEEQPSPPLLGKRYLRTRSYSKKTHKKVESPPRTRVTEQHITKRGKGGQSRHKLRRMTKRYHGDVPKTKRFHGNMSKTSCDLESSSSSDEEGVRVVWVQCDRVECGKWRRVPSGVQIDQSKEWYCSMHPDPAYQSCDRTEEHWTVSKKRAFTFTKLDKGSLVWAQIGGYPRWPAIVSPDPWSEMAYVNEEREGCIYHVEFLGKKRSHIWLQEEKIEPYRQKTTDDRHWRNRPAAVKAKQKTQSLLYAISEADSMLELTNEQRLAECVFTECTTSVGRVKTEPGAQKKVKTEKYDLENSSLSLNTEAQSSSKGVVKKRGRPKRNEKRGRPKRNEKRGRLKRNESHTTAVSPGTLLKSISNGGSNGKTSLNFLQSLQLQLNILLNTSSQTSCADKELGPSKPSVNSSSSDTRSTKLLAAQKNKTSGSRMKSSALSLTGPGKQSLLQRESNHSQGQQRTTPTRLVQTGLKGSAGRLQLVPATGSIVQCGQQRTAGRKKRAQSKKSAQSVSPTIVDYFKNRYRGGSPQAKKSSQESNTADHLVPTVTTIPESPLYQTLDSEAQAAQCELQEIQDLLSIFSQPEQTTEKSVKEAGSTSDYSRQTVLCLTSAGKEIGREQIFSLDLSSQATREVPLDGRLAVSASGNQSKQKGVSSQSFLASSAGNEDGKGLTFSLSDQVSSSRSLQDSTTISTQESVLPQSVLKTVSSANETLGDATGPVYSKLPLAPLDNVSLLKDQDTEFDSTLKELDHIEHMIQDLADQQVPSL